MRRVLLAFTAIIVGIVFASGSVMLLTDNHLFMPDNQLYDLQILAESVRLSLTLNPVERAALSLDWVSRRLDEVESMANTRFLPAALANLEAELDTAVHHILNTPAADQPPLLERLDRLLIRAEVVSANQRKIVGFVIQPGVVLSIPEVIFFQFGIGFLH
ncbi:MAG: DUF5667 domain-containing protein [Chloroflexota bacterium]